MALTYAYSLHAQGQLNVYIKNLGEDRNNLLPNPITGKLIQNKLEDLFLPACEEMVCSNLRGGRVITSLAPYADREITDVTISDVYFPWNRTFEIAFTIGVTLAED